jgi:hypothetical protein
VIIEAPSTVQTQSPTTHAYTPDHTLRLTCTHAPTAVAVAISPARPHRLVHAPACPHPPALADAHSHHRSLVRPRPPRLLPTLAAEAESDPPIRARPSVGMGWLNALEVCTTHCILMLKHILRFALLKHLS